VSTDTILVVFPDVGDEFSVYECDIKQLANFRCWLDVDNTETVNAVKHTPGLGNKVLSAKTKAEALKGAFDYARTHSVGYGVNYLDFTV
jgi:hypothetical protein